MASVAKLVVHRGERHPLPPAAHYSRGMTIIGMETHRLIRLLLTLHVTLGTVCGLSCVRVCQVDPVIQW